MNHEWRQVLAQQIEERNIHTIMRGAVLLSAPRPGVHDEWSLRIHPTGISVSAATEQGCALLLQEWNIPQTGWQALPTSEKGTNR